MMLIGTAHVVQHLFHRYAVPLLLRRRYVLIHSTGSGKILAFISGFFRQCASARK